jgi:ElaB/YqjD/DUF883 family membrane-anchored ribosome-binding protein
MSRKYSFNGIEYPSVTTILDILDKSGALMGWAVKCTGQYIIDNYSEGCDIDELVATAKREYRNVSDEAKDIGTEIHNKIEQYIKKGKDAVGEMDERVENAFIAFLEWESENIDEWIESEKNVFDPHYGFAGTLDAVAKFKDGRVMVLDFKSSKGFYDGYDKQISAYKYARDNLTGTHDVVSYDGSIYKVTYPEIKSDGCGILRLDKATGMPEFKDYTKKYDRQIKSFLQLTKFYYQDKKRRLKNNPRVI